MRADRPGFRPDVEGLRAVAIGAVLAYHAGLPFVRGGYVGVDVFFVISGFLITGLVVRELERTGRVGLPRFYARRARRLLPASLLVLAVTAMGAYLVLPVLDHPVVAGDVAASAAYVSNLRFAAQQTDYLAADRAPSPVLHYWSLGVEEQFYLVWPLLLLVVAVLARRAAAHRGPARTRPGPVPSEAGRPGPFGPALVRPALVAAMAAVGAASFALSLRLTGQVQPWAFFGTPARGWEFAAGGLVALGAGALTRVPTPVRALAGWAGLAAVLGSAVLLTDETPFPGTAALWPVLGTAAVIAAGAGTAGAGAGTAGAGRAAAEAGTAGAVAPTGGPGAAGTMPAGPVPSGLPPVGAVPAGSAGAGPAPVGPAPAGLRGVAGLLSAWPMRAVGRMSYSWYLWHWPVLVLVAAAVGPLPPVAGLLVVLASAVPAALAYRFVERPVHLAPALAVGARPGLLLGAACSLAGLLAAAALALAPAPPVTLASGSATAGVAGGDEGPQRPAPPPPPATSAGPSPGGTASGGTATGGTATGDGTPQGTASAPTPAPVPAATGPLRPEPGDARADIPPIYADGCHVPAGGTLKTPCAFGDTAAATTVVLLGDSHAAQWFPAVDAAARERGWRLLVRTMSGCPAPDVTVWRRALKRAYSECDGWRGQVLDELTGPGRPAAVLATSTATRSLVDRGSGDRLDGQAADDAWRDGWERTLRRLAAADVPVVVLRDTPWPGADVPACVAQHPDDTAACDAGVGAVAAADLDVGVAARVPGTRTADLTPRICGPDRCAAVLDAPCAATGCTADRPRLLVYRDDNHLTATFAASLAGPLGDAVAAALPGT